MARVYLYMHVGAGRDDHKPKGACGDPYMDALRLEEATREIRSGRQKD